MADKNKPESAESTSECNASIMEEKTDNLIAECDLSPLSRTTESVSISFKMPGLPALHQNKHEIQDTTITKPHRNKPTNVLQTSLGSTENDSDFEKKKDLKESFKTPSESFKTPALPSEEKTTETKNGDDCDHDVNKANNTKVNTQNTVGKNGQTVTKKSALSPAEQLKQTQVVIPYKEPSWSGLPEDKYSLDVLKNGTIVSTIDLEKPYYVFGRLPSCDVTMEHPSLSRYHAVIQYCKGTPGEGKEKGWYLYDLDSTHGTWVNKHKTYPNKYYRIRVGHIVKFGGSTRLHILQGPDEDAEEESDLTPTEMKEQREKQKREAEILRQAEIAAEEQKIEEMKRIEEARGCSWGMGDDAAEEEDEEEKGESAMGQVLNILTPESEALYINDPKKALKGYFEREGCEEPEYEVVDAGKGKFKCTVELPVDTAAGEPMVAEATVSGKKKDAVVQCALEACRLLDRQGLLRASKHESRKKKKKNWADDDYYDSDDDTYLDRTGDIEKKRKQRMDKAGKGEEGAQNYDTLLEKHKKILQEIEEIESKLEKAKAEAAAAMTDGELDALDAYMSAIKSGMMDTKTKMKLKRQLMELKQEEQKTRKLVNIAKPTSMPELKRPDPKDMKKADVKGLPAFGKIKSLQKTTKKPTVPVSKPLSFDNNRTVEEEEEEEEEEENKTKGKSDVKILDSQAKDNSSAEKSVIKTVKKSNEIKGPHRPPASQHRDMEDTSEGDKSVPPQTQDIVDTMDVVTEESQVTKDAVDQQKAQGKRQRKTDTTDKKTKKRKQDPDVIGPTYDSTDPDYAVWVPPSNQSGDGKTHLNAKFGY